MVAGAAARAAADRRRAQGEGAAAAPARAAVLQPYRDLWRLMRKEAVVADNASWLFRVAPYLIFAATWVAAALVPTFATGLLFSWSADLIAIVALLGTARFCAGAGRHGCRHRFGGIGSCREMMIASLAEPAMLMSCSRWR